MHIARMMLSNDFSQSNDPLACPNPLTFCVDKFSVVGRNWTDCSEILSNLTFNLVQISLALALASA